MSKSSSKGGRFLVVEDDESVAREAIVPLLRPFGESTVVGDFQEGKRQLDGSKGEWTGVVLDVRLPGGSGLALLRVARPRWPLMPIMLITGFNEDKAANAAFDLRAEYVIKPIKPQRIRRFARDALGRVERPPLDRRIQHVVDVWDLTFLLSDAESDILRRAASGDDRATIASARGVSEETIHKQVTGLLLKVGRKTLHAAVEAVLREAARP